MAQYESSQHLRGRTRARRSSAGANGELISAESVDVRSVGMRVSRRRKQLQLNQEQLASRAGMSEAYVNRLENGIVGNPKIIHLAAMARALGISLDSLLGVDSPACESDLADLIARQPRLSNLLSSLVRGLQWADPEDRDFVVSHLESLARRFGDKAAAGTATRRP